LEVSVPARRRFQLVLVKPSHYDDDGYVIRWWRAMIPSNSLAAVYGIAADCAERQVLGPDVAIVIDVFRKMGRCYISEAELYDLTLLPKSARRLALPQLWRRIGVSSRSHNRSFVSRRHV
jgi:hypothetical protein